MTTTPAPQGIPPEYAAGYVAQHPEAARPVGSTARSRETDEHAYARQTRNATVFIAWIVGVLTLFSVIVGIVAAVALSHLAGSVVTGTTGGGGSNILNCQSLGGTDPSC